MKMTNVEFRMTNGEKKKIRHWPGVPTRFSELVKWMFLMFPAVIMVVGLLLLVVRLCVVSR